jgi:hypothetical protein
MWIFFLTHTHVTWENTFPTADRSKLTLRLKDTFKMRSSEINILVKTLWLFRSFRIEYW